MANDLFRGVAKDLFDGGISEMDLALGVHEDDRIRGSFPKQAVTPFAFLQSAFCFALSSAVGGFAQFPINGGRQTAEVALHQIIVRSGLHCRHGDILTDAAGDNDEGHIEAAFL